MPNTFDSSLRPSSFALHPPVPPVGSSSKTDWCLAGNEGMDPIESLLGAHSLILYVRKNTTCIEWTRTDWIPFDSASGVEWTAAPVHPEVGVAGLKPSSRREIGPAAPGNRVTTVRSAVRTSLRSSWTTRPVPLLRARCWWSTPHSLWVS